MSINDNFRYYYDRNAILLNIFFPITYINQEIMSKLLKAAVIGATTLLAAGQAYAQPGSRVCGWFATNQMGNFAFVYESREKDVSDKQQCNGFIDAIAGTIVGMNPADPKLDQQTKAKLTMLKSMTWQKVGHGTKCESLGEKFVDDGKYKSKDMCDNMGAKGKGYFVSTTMQGGKKVTVYTQN